MIKSLRSRLTRFSQLVRLGPALLKDNPRRDDLISAAQRDVATALGLALLKEFPEEFEVINKNAETLVMHPQFRVLTEVQYLDLKRVLESEEAIKPAVGLTIEDCCEAYHIGMVDAVKSYPALMKNGWSEYKKNKNFK